MSPRRRTRRHSPRFRSFHRYRRTQELRRRRRRALGARHGSLRHRFHSRLQSRSSQGRPATPTPGGTPTAGDRGTAGDRRAAPVEGAVVAGTAVARVDASDSANTGAGAGAAAGSRTGAPGSAPAEAADAGSTAPGSPPAKPAQAVPVWRQAMRTLGGRPTFIFWIVVASFFAGICESFVLALLAQVASALVTGGTRVAVHLGPVHIDTSIVPLLMLGIAVSLVRLGLQFVLSWLPSRLAADTQAAMRQRMFAAYRGSSWAIQSADGEGRFQDLMTSQIMQATQAVVQSTTAVSSAVMLGVLVAAAVVVGVVPAMVVIAASAVLFVLLRPINKLGRRHARELSVAQVNYAAGVHDAVHLAEEAQVFGVGGAQQVQLDGFVEIARVRFLATQFLMRLVPGFYQGMILLLVLIGLAVLSATQAGHVASLGAVVLLLVRASSYGQSLQGAFHQLHQSLPFVERVDREEARYIDNRVVRGTRTLRTVPTIEFENVAYSYIPGVRVLSELHFAVAPGESIGVVGPTGAGKSTLVQLLLGLREPGVGRYLVEGHEALSWSTDSWARSVAYLSQEPRLLHGTVADNIRFYRDLDDATVERAARQAHIHDEILSWPDGYDTEVSQRARAVSGGQRQRLCLARALAGSPVVLVLDEPTSSLDPRSESLVQRSLNDLKGQLTLFVIAHRFSTLSLCDRVMVMEGGRLQAFAPAEELLQSNDFYRKASSLSLSGATRPDPQRAVGTAAG